jgi:hypothetical protein
MKCNNFVIRTLRFKLIVPALFVVPITHEMCQHILLLLMTNYAVDPHIIGEAVESSNIKERGPSEYPMETL